MTHSNKRAYFFKIDTTVKRVRSFLQKQLNEAKIDLTVDQWVVIDHLMPSPGISQNDLANATAKDAPTITRILGILLKKGLVEKRLGQKDRRKFELFLTNDGQKLHKLTFPVVADFRTETWGNLSDKDYDDLVRIMDKIYSNVD